MSFTIDKNVPIPAQRRKSGFVNIMKEMNIGDSVEAHSLQQTCSFREIARRYGYNITSRSIGNGKYRVWLIGMPPAKDKG